MSEPLSMLLLVGLTLRLLRLVQVDAAGVIVRAPLVRVCAAVGKHRGIEFAESLLACPFCVGFWISVVTSWSWLAFGDMLVWQAAALPFTVSWLVGHLAVRLDLSGEE